MHHNHKTYAYTRARARNTKTHKTSNIKKRGHLEAHAYRSAASNAITAVKVGLMLRSTMKATGNVPVAVTSALHLVTPAASATPSGVRRWILLS